MIKLPSIKIDQVRNGKWKEFNKHGVLIAEGSYVNNKKHGIWREYYDHNGAMMIEENYDCGISHGRYASFHPNGQILSEGQFYHGSRVGYFKIYDEQGNNIRNLHFVNDIQVKDINGAEHDEDSARERKTGS